MSTFENTGEFMQHKWRWFLSKDLLWFDTCHEGKRINKMSQEENLHVSLEDAFGTSLHVCRTHPWFQLQLLWVSSWEPRFISLCEHPVFSSVWQPSLRSQESLHLELQPSNAGIDSLGLTLKQERQELVDKKQVPASFLQMDSSKGSSQTSQLLWQLLQ